ncbi:hypothetical protein CICLE_v10013278mg [Citrus x clementina]|uniref:Uncharacterized protein n=1 Tax=Citrus clementina TaxID=85681 RepID=V4SYG8_CITCL|nr:hypothetical protein CICLE_v10013278mg [Citrus x clementina]
MVIKSLSDQKSKICEQNNQKNSFYPKISKHNVHCIQSCAKFPPNIIDQKFLQLVSLSNNIEQAKTSILHK